MAAYSGAEGMKSRTSPSSRSARPWSSGRVLTSVQRERKRRMNRASKCERQKHHTARIRTIDERITKLERRYLSLKGCTDLSIDPETCLPRVLDYAKPSCLTTVSDNHLGALQFNLRPRKLDHLSPTDDPIDESATDNHSRILRTQMDSMHDMGYLRIATTILAAVLTLQPSQISLDENVNQDVLICGVLDGWEHLQNQDWICPLWRIIQQIDLSITINSGIVTRLCMLRGMHLYLLSLVSPKEIFNLPVWYLPRPPQLSFAHDLVIDYFTWPAFRERLVSTQSPRLDDRFWYYFAKCFRFDWPFDISCAFASDAGSGKLRFSPVFNAYAYDINKFSMDPEFFHVFPEVYNDMCPR